MSIWKKETSKISLKFGIFLYNKVYDYNTEEGLKKFRVFKANVEKIKENNKVNTSFQEGINHLTDLTHEEFLEYYNLKPMDTKAIKTGLRKLVTLDEYEETTEVIIQEPVVARNNVNWISMTLPIRNQANCGSCWSFATMATVEANWNMYKGQLNGWLSTQQLVDCDTTNQGCRGGWYRGSFAHLKSYYAIADSAYPYYSGSSGQTYQCQQNSITPTNVRISTYEAVSNNADEVYRLLGSGPVAVLVDAATFQSYTRGIFNWQCSSVPNHAVVLVGYGSEGNVGYWIIRNSWGDWWGEGGHMRIMENINNSNSCLVGSSGYLPRF